MTALSSISLPDIFWIAPFLQKSGKDPDQDALPIIHQRVTK